MNPKTVRRFVGIALLQLAATTVASVTSANCPLPEPRVVWSYPAAGATDVPIDADIMFVFSNWNTPSQIDLNGERVDAFDEGRFDPGTLEPNTDYTVTIASEGMMGPVSLELSFATGDQSVEATTQAPVIASQAQDDLTYPLDSDCPEVINAQDCFDTGQSTMLRLQVEGEAVLWLVQAVPDGEASSGGLAQERWPFECGDPTVVGWRSAGEFEGGCYRVVAVDAAGNEAPSELFCGGAGDGGGGSGGGLCSLSTTPTGPAPAAASALLLLLFACRQRRPRVGGGSPMVARSDLG